METKASGRPSRQCVGCRRRLPPAELVRFVRAEAGWRADAPARHKQPGRGAYLCSRECAEAARRNKRYPGLATVAVEYEFKRGSSNADFE